MKALLLLAALLLAACAPKPAPPLLDWTETERELIATLSPLPPLPPDPTNAHAESATAAELGRSLFFDPGLSPDASFSCATCHLEELGLADGLPLPKGRSEIARHAPTLWNVASQRWFFWDGRADTLWGQAAGPMESPAEMGSDRLFVLRHVAAEPDLASLYEMEFGELPPVLETRFPEHARPGADDHEATRNWAALSVEDRALVDAGFANLLKAIASFERSFVSGASPFDRFARGLASGDPDELGALSFEAQRGLRIFLGQGRCTLCHFGPLFSDREFHDTRVPPLGGGPASDAARYDGIAALHADPSFTSFGPHSNAPDGEQARLSKALVREGRTWGEFKTPSLRQVALSPPYMHQGQFESLAEVVRYYSTLEGALPLGHHQETLLMPAELDEGQQGDLVAFLESLTSRSTVE